MAVDGSSKTDPTNVRGRASTTLPRLALVRYECDRSLLLYLWVQRSVREELWMLLSTNLNYENVYNSTDFLGFESG